MTEPIINEIGVKSVLTKSKLPVFYDLLHQDDDFAVAVLYGPVQSTSLLRKVSMSIEAGSADESNINRERFFSIETFLPLDLDAFDQTFGGTCI
ncbi:MAG: hypothetical protein HFE84_00930 [Lachnospiraceae bacterium]|nr:hypothetical protein [Lachnospiraceae bacterium]